MHKTLKDLWDKHKKKIEENRKQNALESRDVNKKFQTVTRIPWPPCFQEEYRERALRAPYTGKQPPATLEIIDPWESDGKPWMPEYVRSLASYRRYTMREAWDHLVRQHGIKRVAKEWQEQFAFVLLPIEKLPDAPAWNTKLENEIRANLKQWEKTQKGNKK